MKTTLYLARHGETQWNKIQRFQGQLDSKLTELGKKQSKRIAEQVASHNVDLIISSHLGRAIETAAICQQQLNINNVINENLSERNLGEWQGKQIAQLTKHAHYIELLHEYTQLNPIGGESAIDCGKRILKAFHTIIETYAHKSILVILHGEALRCFFSALGKNNVNQPQNAYDLFQNGSVSTLAFDHNNNQFTLN